MSVFFCNFRPDYNSHRIVCVYKMEEMWNAVFREHQTTNPDCKGLLLWDLANEEMRGLGCRQNVICSSCRYKSKRYTLYEELQTQKAGRKNSKLNMSIHVGLSQTPIAQSGLRKILLSGNIQAPSAATLQRRANIVMKEIEKANKKDMQRKREEIIEINRLRGKEDPNIISIQTDGMYNNPLYSGVGRTPFQPATQTVYSAAENITTKHNILSIVGKNKLCSKHSSLDIDPNSGRLHEMCDETCSANISMAKSIGDEYSWARECLLDLKKDNIEVEYLVTDPDSSAYKAAQDLCEENITKTETEHFIDTRHLSDNMRKGIKKNANLLKIMPGRTKQMRQKYLNNFATDITERCSGELVKAVKQYAGDLHKVKNKISFTVDAVARCYMGDHSGCKVNSLLCKGPKKPWLKKRPFLPQTFKIHKSSENLSILREAINKRLGQKIIDKTRLNMNTNFVEGFNRSIRRSLPSNVTYKRNFTGRLHSAAHSVNNGPGESILELCSALHCDIPVGSSAYNALKQVQRTDILQKQHKQTIKYKKFRSEKRIKLYQLYEKLKEIIEYEKNVLLKAERELQKTPIKHDDHSYGKNKKRRKVSVRK